ncbi:MAG: hypothetical protein HXX15_18390 [Rhodopseudomonas sp.]|uniref:hypothetical protein n=1 Tax=Rhodopseudomonas sp. TaxID=1078 RepID=UPI001818B02A|nr:hypothetical protein [Rhodopseudomonas sp.]NVN88053.1 hypothetical protein [Rhodopseudomonas sp.]
MQQFIRNENFKLYRRALNESSDHDQRRVLKALLQILVVQQAAHAAQPRQMKPETTPETQLSSPACPSRER